MYFCSKPRRNHMTFDSLLYFSFFFANTSSNPRVPFLLIKKAHCKWRAGENPILISSSHLCILRNETVQPRYFQIRNIMFCLPISTLTLYNLWEIYCIYFQNWSVSIAAAKYVNQSCEYINSPQTHECRNWDWGRAIPFPGIHKWDFRYSAVVFSLLRAWSTTRMFPAGSKDTWQSFW